MSGTKKGRDLVVRLAAHAGGLSCHYASQAGTSTTATSAGAVICKLLQLSGLRPRPELRELAKRFDALP
jgi:hypothetical protein